MIEEQLQRWQARGFEVSLLTTVDGKWYCAVGTYGWIMRDPRPNEARDEMSLRLVTATCATPQAAIDAALKVLQP